jgi:hypothetical protein
MKNNDEGSENKLSNKEAMQYRGLVARANYLCQDRSDIQSAVKELSCRGNAGAHTRQLVGTQEVREVFDRKDQGDNQVQLSKGAEE